MLPHHRRPVKDGARAVAAGWWGWAIVLVLSILVPTACHIGQAHAEPRFIAHAGQVLIILHDERCAFAEQVTNLHLRATWREPNGDVVEGCWGVNGADLVMLYFSDRTVVALPKQLFARLGGS